MLSIGLPGLSALSLILGQGHCVCSWATQISLTVLLSIPEVYCAAL